MALPDDIATLNNRGIAHEKSGNLAGAIECYEKNIQFRCPATHSYDRLLVLYKKFKRVADQARVAGVAVEVFEAEVARRKAAGIMWENVEKTLQSYKRRLEQLGAHQS